MQANPTEIVAEGVNGFVLALDNPNATLELAGGKGASLARLAAAGLPVPGGFHITTAAYERFVRDNQIGESILAVIAEAIPGDSAAAERASIRIQELFLKRSVPAEIAASIRHAYSGLGVDNPSVAVRSSATAEDLPELSFAGQQETYLNIRGAGNVIEAVKRCWASLWTARAIEYRARQKIAPDSVSIAVVVQQLVAADAAGVVFTANPLTGERGKVIINAAWGLGEAIVSGAVTPDTIVVDKQTRAVISSEIADKKVMTVLLDKGTEEQPVAAEKRRQAALGDSQLSELVDLSLRIEQLYGQPMDIEWALDQGRLFILQARPITALPKPHPPLVWVLPDPRGRYVRSSIIELMPEPLSPLFATLALPIWGESLQELIQRYGMAGMMRYPVFLTVNDYAYYDMTMSAWQSIRLAIKIPSMFVRTFHRLREGEAEWKNHARPCYQAVIAHYAAGELTKLTAIQLLEGVRAIVRAAADHYTSVQSGIIPAANMGEAIFTWAYNRLAKRKGDPPALTFLLGFDSTPILGEKSLFDLAMWAESQPELASYLGLASSGEIAAAYNSASSPIDAQAVWTEFRDCLHEYLDRFGHAIYDLDFAKSLPAEQPASVLETLKFFMAGVIHNPYDRQAAAVLVREQATESLFNRLGGLRLRLFKWLLPWAQSKVPLREDALADVGLGWPLLRRLVAELGQRLADAGAMASRDDVFWLTAEEAKDAAQGMDGGQHIGDYRGVIAERRVRWDQERSVPPPVALPIKGGVRLLGFNVTRMMPARTIQAEGPTIKGQGASPGRVAGTARVIRGQDEFDQMRPGDILVAKITTPAWTPLFALASGVVTDVGGTLSHSSIVAREYHIPAVLGTSVATERIRNGQHIVVDGDAGTVTLST